MSTELVKLKLPENPAEIFVQDYVDTMLANIRQQATSIKADLDTAKGRKEIVAVAAAVAKSKVHIDTIGKDHVAKAKAEIKVVDNLRKQVRDTLDELKEEVRGPVTAWEEEETRRKQGIREAIEYIRNLPAQINNLASANAIFKELDETIVEESTFMEMTEEAEEEARQADEEHRCKVLRETSDALREIEGMPSDLADEITAQIEGGYIPHVTLNF